MANRSTFTASLKDDVTPGARTATTSLTAMRSKIDADVKALASMQSALRRMKQGGQSGTEAFKRLSTQMETTRNRIARSEASFVSLGGRLNGIAAPASSFEGALASMIGPLATVGASVVAFAATVLGAAAAFAVFALRSADARRSELLHLEGLTTLRNAYGVAAGSARDLVAAIDRVSDSSALSRGEVSGMAESLYRAGLRGANLSDALEGLSIAQSVQGDRGAARFRALAVSTARVGGSVSALAATYRARLGPIATRQALGLERQTERLRESIGHIFDGVGIEHFLSGMHDVLSVFSQSTATGRALQGIARTALTPLFDSAGAGAPSVVNALRGIVIAMLRVQIVALHVRDAWRGNVDSASPLLRTIALLREAFDGFTLSVQPAVDVLSEFGEGLSLAVGDLFDSLGGRSVAPRSAGEAMAAGLAGGIRSGAPDVAAATRDLGAASSDALRSSLQIHSPSRLFAGFGRQIPRGLAMGVERGESEVASATESVAAAATSGVPRGGLASALRAPVSIVANITIQGGGRQAGEDAADAFLDRISTAFDGVAITMGAGAT